MEETDDLLVDPMDEKIFYQLRQDFDGIIKEIYTFDFPEKTYYNQMHGHYMDGIENSHNLNIVLDYIETNVV